MQTADGHRALHELGHLAASSLLKKPGTVLLRTDIVREISRFVGLSSKSDSSL